MEQVDDDWQFLGRLPALRFLGLYGTNAIDSPEKLGNFRQLRTIWLYDQLVPASFAEAVQKNNPLCRVVSGMPPKGAGNRP